MHNVEEQRINKRPRIELELDAFCMGNKQSSTPGEPGSGSQRDNQDFDAVSSGGLSRSKVAKHHASNAPDRSTHSNGPKKPPKNVKPDKMRAINNFGTEHLSVQGTHMIIASPHKVAPSPSDTMALRPANPTNPTPVNSTKQHNHTTNAHVKGNSQSAHIVTGSASPSDRDALSRMASTDDAGKDGQKGIVSNTHSKWEQNAQRQDNFSEEQTQDRSRLQNSAAKPSASPFDFSLTEGQTRRTLMADCELECSEVSPGVFVSGAKVAVDKDMLMRHNIRRIVNCAVSVVPCAFSDEPERAPAATDIHTSRLTCQNSKMFTYLALNMVDGRQDDVGWFACQVLQFVQVGRTMGHNTLVHCEQGISRSCSFAIAWLMWSTRIPWKQAYNLVKERRLCSNPNTAFTCHLIEIGDLLHGEQRKVTNLFRLAQHLPHDRSAPVLKALRDESTRKLLPPNLSLLDTRGVFVLRPGQEDVESGSATRETANQGPFVWVGSIAAMAAANVEVATRLAECMVGILTAAGTSVTVVWQGREPPAFLAMLQSDSVHNRSVYDDLFGVEAVTAGALAESIGSETDVSEVSSKVGSSAPAPIKVTKPEKVVSSAVQIVPKGDSIAGKVSTLVTGPIAAGNTQPVPSAEEKHRSPSTGALTPVHSSSRPSSGTSSAPRPRAPSDLSSPQAQAVPLLTQEQRRLTPTLPRTPSVGKMPEDVAMVREPTPIEDAGRTSVGSVGSAAGNISSPGPVSQLPHVQRILQGDSSSTIGATTVADTKPKLYVCVASDDGGEGAFEWQAMGVYDDEDLDEGLLLLLHCRRGQHMLWVGQDYADEHRKLCQDEDALLDWVCQQVAPGENTLWVDVFPCDVSLQRSGEEDGPFWDAFQEGF